MRKTVSSASIIFLIALLVRFFIWQDMRFEAWKVQSGVVELYRVFARYILEDGFLSLFDTNARIASVDLISHPPGYSLLLTGIFYFFGESNLAVQCLSIFFDALSAIVIFLIAKKLFSRRAAFVAGILAALSPQFALNSVFLLPDSLAVFPILLAILFLINAFQNPKLQWMIWTGICLGVSCWLRGNALLLPLFFAAAVLLLFERKRSLTYAFVLCAAFALTIAPISIRNAVVYKRFIPVSLGAGQTLLEGIGDYDPSRRLGIPNTDFAICQLEAGKYGRPDYAKGLFGADGIWREQQRLALGRRIIGENPLWFAGVVARRGFSILQLERAQNVSGEIPVTAPIPSENQKIILEKTGAQLLDGNTLIAPGASILTLPDETNLLLQTDDSKYDAQFAAAPFTVQKNRDYEAEIILRLKSGRISAKISGVNSGKFYASAIADLTDYKTTVEQPVQTMKIYFVPSTDEPVKLIVSNETPNPPTSLVEIKSLKITDLGASHWTWTRPLRLIVKFAQKIFTTPVMLPPAFFGLLILLRRREGKTLLILLLVPLYYMCVQSILHTEYRYVMALHYFLFALAAISITAFAGFALGKIKPRLPKFSF